MLPGSIDVKYHGEARPVHLLQEGKPFSDEYTDAKTALRVMPKAPSILPSSFAGLNQSLFNYMTRFGNLPE